MENNASIIKIGISGATCSGKTSLALLLCETLKEHGHVNLIQQDNYFHKVEMIPLQNGQHNWECPEALDMTRFSKDVVLLLNNVTNRCASCCVIENDKSDVPVDSQWPSLPLKQMDVGDLPNTKTVKPSSCHFVIVEGFLLYRAFAPSFFDVALYLDTNYASCKQRRQERVYPVVSDDVDSSYFIDPPGYFDSFVWKEYIKYMQLVDSYINTDDCKQLYRFDATLLTLEQIEQSTCDLICNYKLRHNI